jgi:hypothetical protein
MDVLLLNVDFSSQTPPPTDLSLLNEAREFTEILIDAMHLQIRESFGHKPRTHRKQARQEFQAGDQEYPYLNLLNASCWQPFYFILSILLVF